MSPSMPCKKKYQKTFYKKPFYKIVDQQTEIETMSAMNIENGNKVWRNPAGQLHREDGPAIECSNGHKEWWVEGRFHRTDGPAREWSRGQKEWWLNNTRHRTDGPAIEWSKNHKEWYVNGKRHRVNGPAVEYENGDTEWWLNNTRHRTDGPAVETAYRHSEWWVNNLKISKQEISQQRSKVYLQTLLLSRVVNPFCEVNVANYCW